MIEDYAYARADFRGDPDLALHEGSQWGDRGKNIFHYILFLYFYYEMFILFT
jgi:hypothetical protein